MNLASNVIAAMIGILIAVLLSSGCAGVEPGQYPNFWTQKVAFTGWGFTMATAYGPFNIGYLTWARNVENPPKPSQPGDVIGILPRATVP
jgi:hypothetical protein